MTPRPASVPVRVAASTTPLLEEAALMEEQLKLSLPKIPSSSVNHHQQQHGVRDRAQSLSAQQRFPLEQFINSNHHNNHHNFSRSNSSFNNNTTNINHNKCHQRRLSSAGTTSSTTSINQRTSDPEDKIIVRRRNSAALAITSSAVTAAAVMVGSNSAKLPSTSLTSNHYSNRTMTPLMDENESQGEDDDEEYSSGDSLIQPGPVQLILREISADSYATFL
jgi:hypothetical protein